MLPWQKRNKYGAKKIRFDGIVFDSMGEYQYYLYLKEIIKPGKMEIHPVTFLTRAKIKYISDFLIDENGKKVYIDFKGIQTDAFKLKKRLWMHYGEGILRIVKKERNGFKVIEEIDPYKRTYYKNWKTKKF